MRERAACWFPIFLATIFLSPALCAQATRPRPAAKSQAPKPQTAAPDLAGLWLRPHASKYLDAARRFEAQKPSMTPWAQAKFDSTRGIYSEASPQSIVERLSGADPTYSCFPPGVPGIYFRVTGDARPMEIINAPARVMQFFEYDHYVRQIWTDGRAHSPDLAPTWMGESIGKWEGDTLVVDSIGFNDKTVLDSTGHPHSDQLHLVERIRRLDGNTLEDVLTVTDPKAYTKPWSGQLIFTRAPADWTIMEDVCEDNVNFLDFIKKANSGTK